MNLEKGSKKYKILDGLIPLTIESDQDSGDTFTLAPGEIHSCQDWFQMFKSRVDNAVRFGKNFPIVRCSDGEYTFLLGEQPPSNRESPKDWVKGYLRYLKGIWRRKFIGFCGTTAPGISVGKYNPEEIERGIKSFTKGLKYVLNNGILAAHLTMGRKPFQERFHPAFKKWLVENRLSLTTENYAPFYFVYVLLNAKNLSSLVQNREVLLVHSAQDYKRKKIVDKILKAGASRVHWYSISSERSLFDSIQMSEKISGYDICFLGAGVGKFSVVRQLADFQGPIIDAGYMFEAWANPEIASLRAFCSVAN